MPEHTRNTAKPASEEGPEQGHTFRFTTVVRSSSRVVGEGDYHDAPDFDGLPVSFEVREWSLTAALAKAADLPFDVLMADLEEHERAMDAEEPDPASAVADDLRTLLEARAELLEDWDRLGAARQSLAPTHERLVSNAMAIVDLDLSVLIDKP